MWVNPSHPITLPSAPEDQGQRLATFPRDCGAAELRVSLDSFNGNRFISCRIWTRDSRNREVFWPSKKGVSIRIGECAEVASALASVASGLPSAGPSLAPGAIGDELGDDRPVFVDRGPRVRKSWKPEALSIEPPGKTACFTEFDEFT